MSEVYHIKKSALLGSVALSVVYFCLFTFNTIGVFVDNRLSTNIYAIVTFCGTWGTMFFLSIIVCVSCRSTSVEINEDGIKISRLLFPRSIKYSDIHSIDRYKYCIKIIIKDNSSEKILFLADSDKLATVIKSKIEQMCRN